MNKRLRDVLFTPVVIYAGNGQSTSIGLLGEPSAPSVAKYGATRFKDGIRSRGWALDLGVSPPTDYTQFEPAIESDSPVGNYGKTGLVAGAAFFSEKLSEYLGIGIEALGFTSHIYSSGRGGASLLQIGDGGAYAADARTQINSSPAGSCLFNVNMSIGQTDQSRGEPGYDWQKRFIAHHDDMVKIVMADTGQNWTPITIGSQIASHWRYASDPTGYPLAHRTPEIALATMRAAQEHPDIFCPVADFIFTHPDNVHNSADAYDLRDKYKARCAAKIAAARILRQPDPTTDAVPRQTWLIGRTLFIQYDLPHGPGQVRTDLVAQTWNNGYDTWLPDRVTHVDNISPSTPPRWINRDTVAIDFTSDPVPGNIVSYAWGRPGMTTTGPLTGPRGNMFDSEGEVDIHVDSTGAAIRMDNPLLIHEVVIPQPSVSGGQVFKPKGEARSYGLKRQASQVVAGKFYRPAGFSQFGTPSQIDAGRIYLVRWDTPLWATALYAEVTTGVAGFLRAGIYAMTRRGRIGGLNTDLGQLPTDTADVRQFLFAAAKQFSDRPVFLAVQPSVNMLIRRSSTSNAFTSSIAGAASPGATAAESYYRTAALAYGPLPATLPAIEAMESSSPPEIGMVGA